MEVHHHAHTADPGSHRGWKKGLTISGRIIQALPREEREKENRKYMLNHPKEEMEGETEILR